MASSESVMLLSPTMSFLESVKAKFAENPNMYVPTQSRRCHHHIMPMSVSDPLPSLAKKALIVNGAIQKPQPSAEQSDSEQLSV